MFVTINNQVINLDDVIYISEVRRREVRYITSAYYFTVHLSEKLFCEISVEIPSTFGGKRELPDKHYEAEATSLRDRLVETLAENFGHFKIN